MPGMSLSVCICLNCRPSSPAAADVRVAMVPNVCGGVSVSVRTRAVRDIFRGMRGGSGAGFERLWRLWEMWWWVEVVGWAEAVWERLYAVCYVMLELVEGW